MAGITVRRAVAADITTLIQMRWDVCVEQNVADPADGERFAAYSKALRHFLDRYIDDVQCHYYVAEDGGRLVGTATMWLFPTLPWPGGLHDWQGYVTNVYTIPAYRRRGIARRLMNRLREVAAEHGVTALLLEATPESEPLYYDLGYELSRTFKLKLPKP